MVLCVQINKCQLSMQTADDTHLRQVLSVRGFWLTNSLSALSDSVIAFASSNCRSRSVVRSNQSNAK